MDRSEIRADILDPARFAQNVLRHRIWSKQAQILRAVRDHRDALLKLGFGELDDQDRILGGETDQHDETDLGVDIVVEIA
jgi:hypothetical protein